MIGAKPAQFSSDADVVKQAQEITAALDDVEPAAPVRVYGDRQDTPVAEEDWEDYDIYVAMNGRLPYERKMIYHSKEYHGANWHLPEDEEE